MLKIENYINGELHAPISGNYIDNYNPSKGEVYSLIPNSDEKDVENAVQAAKKAFPSWSKTPKNERSKILVRLADLIEENLEELAIAEATDNGKPLALATRVDIPRASANIRFFATAILHNASQSHHMEEGFTNYTLNNGDKINYGYGWSLNELNDVATIEHGGAIPGYLSMGVFVPSKNVYVIVFSNCGCQSPTNTALEIAALAIDKPKFNVDKTIKLSEIQLKKWVGTYQFNNDVLRYVTFKEGQLYSKREGSPKSFKIHRPIPNPNYQFEEEKFLRFCQSMEAGTGSDNLGTKDNKISAAFRLLRVSSHATSTELKYTNYWTALESLTRDVFERQGGDDENVIAAALPCIAIDYVTKRLKSFIAAFHNIGVVDFQMPGEEDRFSLDGCAPIDLYDVLLDGKKSEAVINQLGDYPFFQYKESWHLHSNF